MRGQGSSRQGASREASLRDASVRFSEDVQDPDSKSADEERKSLGEMYGLSSLTSAEVRGEARPTTVSTGTRATHMEAASRATQRRDMMSVTSEAARSTSASQITTSYSVGTIKSARTVSEPGLSSQDSIMGTVQKRINSLTNFESNFAEKLQPGTISSVPSDRGTAPVDTARSIEGIVNASRRGGGSRSNGITLSFRTAMTIPIVIFILGVCLGLFLPVALLSENARDEILDSYLLVVGEHRQLVDELVQASLLSEALVQRLSNSVSYVENLAKAAQQQSDDCTQMVRVFGIVFFIALVPVSIIFALVLSWLLSRGWRELTFLMSRLEELNFSKDSDEIRRLREGHRSRMRDVAALQDCFLSVSRGMEAFMRFVPETTVRNILRGNKKAMRLHVSPRNVTILFCDIKDFTSISEALNQHDLLFLLTRYFSVMTRIINSFDGVVAEILGDGLLCFWNTPDDCEEHAAKACATALAMNQALIMMEAEFGHLQLPALAIRIGIHTGRVMTGNIGSELKMKFGCIGDPVNLAARLEGLCKFYGVSVLCSGETFKALPKRGFTCRRTDLVKVKGKDEPTQLYEVIDCELTMEDLDDTNEVEFSGAASDVFADGRGSLWPDNFSNARKSVRRSIKMAARESGSSPDHFEHGHGRGRCTLQVAIAMEAIEDSNKAMKVAQTCAGLWEPLRVKLDAVKSGLDPAKNAVGMAITKIKTMTMLTKAQETQEEVLLPPAEPARVESMSQCRSVTGRMSVVIGDEEEQWSEQRRAQIDLYESALQAFQDARFVLARDLLDTLLGETPEDGPALVLQERCLQYIGPDDRIVGLSVEALAAWTGVYQMTGK